MAHNARIRASGFWTLGSVVDPAEFEALDQAQFEALNADDGGTWAPVAIIIIGGAGLRTTGVLDAQGTTTISGALSASNVSQCQMSGTNKLTYASRSISRVQRFVDRVTDLVTLAPTGGTWIWDSVDPPKWKQNADNSNMLAIPIDAHHGNTLASVTARVLGKGGHAALPGTMPKLRVWRRELATGNATQLGSTATDGSADPAAYEAAHDITVGSIAHVVDRTLYSYHATLEGERSPNYVAGLAFLGHARTHTVTSQDED